MSEHRIIAVIPTLGKSPQRLTSAINSVRKQTTQPMRLIVIDNSYEADLQLEDESVDVLHFGINLGWVGALEYIRRNYDFDFLWSIQDDMTLLNDVLAIQMAEMVCDADLAVISPVAVQNQVLHGRYRGGVIKEVGQKEWENITVEEVTTNEFSYDGELAFVVGSGALWRKRALDEISGFDLSLYPVMHVDVDTCLRLRALGWKLKISSAAHIAHDVGGSTVPILSQTLESVNRKRILAKQSEPIPNLVRGTVDLDPDFLYEITRKSSYLFLDISDAANGRITQLKAQLDDERRSNYLRRVFVNLPRRIAREILSRF